MRRERRDLRRRMPAHAVGVQRLAHLATDHIDDEGPDRRRHRREKTARTLVEIRVIHPAGIKYRPVEIVLDHLLESPRHCALALVEPSIEVDLVLLFQMPSDEGGISDALIF